MGVLMGSELRRSLVDDMKVSVSSRKENGEGELHGQRQFLVDEGEAATWRLGFVSSWCGGVRRLPQPVVAALASGGRRQWEDGPVGRRTGQKAELLGWFRNQFF
jgi:hypothetical protein